MSEAIDRDRVATRSYARASPSTKFEIGKKFEKSIFLKKFLEDQEKFNNWKWRMSTHKTRMWDKTIA